MRPLLYYKNNKVFFMSFVMPIFDTHHYVKELEAAGVSTKQAEVQVKMQAEIFSSVIEERLVTKQDLREAISELKTELKAEISDARSETHNLRTELKLEMEELRGKFNIMYWVMGFTLTLITAIFFKLFLH